jgi:hypothetical protein
MRGGVILKDSISGKWYIKAPSPDNSVNEYRELELIILNKFLIDSIFTDSNEALNKDIGTFTDNFRKELIKARQAMDLTELDESLRIIDEIIRRRQAGIDKKIEPKTQTEIDKKTSHQLRVNYWEKIRDQIRELLETARIQIQDTIASRNQAELRNEPVLRNEPSLVEPTSWTEPIEDKELRKQYEDAVEKSNEESRRLRIAREQANQSKRESDLANAELRKSEVSRNLEEEKNRLKRDAIERQQKIDEDMVRKSIQEHKKHEEDNLAIKKAIQLSDIESFKISQVERKKNRLRELKEKLDNAPKEYKKMLESLKHLEKMIDDLEILLAKRNELAKVHKIDKDKITLEYNELIKKGNKKLLEKNQQEVVRLNIMKDDIEKNDDKIKSFEAQIRQGYKQITDSTENTKILQDTIEILQKSNTHLCDNPPCFNYEVKPCSRCRLVYYCSKECQGKDWLIHKRICVPRGGKTRSKKHKIKKSRRYK